MKRKITKKNWIKIWSLWVTIFAPFGVPFLAIAQEHKTQKESQEFQPKLFWEHLSYAVSKTAGGSGQFHKDFGRWEMIDGNRQYHSNPAAASTGVTSSPLYLAAYVLDMGTALGAATVAGTTGTSALSSVGTSGETAKDTRAKQELRKDAVNYLEQIGQTEIINQSYPMGPRLAAAVEAARQNLEMKLAEFSKNYFKNTKQAEKFSEDFVASIPEASLVTQILLANQVM